MVLIQPNVRGSSGFGKTFLATWTTASSARTRCGHRRAAGLDRPQPDLDAVSAWWWRAAATAAT
jgi:hypothetical protein